MLAIQLPMSAQAEQMINYERDLKWPDATAYLLRARTVGNELRQTQASPGGLGVLHHSWMKACSNVAPFGE